VNLNLLNDDQLLDFARRLMDEIPAECRHSVLALLEIHDAVTIRYLSEMGYAYISKHCKPNHLLPFNNRIN
jgi:hypothetical protein